MSEFKIDSKTLRKRVADSLLYMRQAFGLQDTQLMYVTAFYAVAQNGPIGMTELAKELQTTKTTISRVVAYLGAGAVEVSRPVPGLGYVKQFDDPMDTRKKLVALTPSGELVLRNVDDILSGRVSLHELMTQASNIKG